MLLKDVLLEGEQALVSRAVREEGEGLLLRAVISSNQGP